ncbi:MAG: hypothetical protein Fur0032_04490 [Terrimicrobiaceae bacterium]
MKPSRPLQKIRFTSNPCELSTVREQVRKFLADAGFPECESLLVVLALDEACTNIIRHAYQGACRPVRMEMSRSNTSVTFTLRDYGKSCDPEKIRGRALEDFRPGGLGVHIIQQAFDDVEYTPCSRGTRLRLVKKLPASHHSERLKR